MEPFEQIVAAHGDVVLRVCKAVLGPADAEDAWSETFLAALRAYPDLAPGSNVRGWLVTIAHRKALDSVRKGRRTPTPTADLPDAAAHDTHPEELDAALRDCLVALAPKQRGAVVLHHVAGLPYAEVAAILDTTTDAARRSAADGIARLRATYRRGADT